MMATFRKISESLGIHEGIKNSRKEAKPGDTRQTDSGNWYGMRIDKDTKKPESQSYGPEGKEKANVYAKGGDPSKVGEPEKSSSETNADQPERTISGKDKALKERDSRTVDSDVYTRDLEPDDEEFDKRSKNYNGKDISNPPPPFGFSKDSSFMKNNKFPKKYLNVLERAMNCKVAKKGGFEPAWSHFSDEAGGAGRIGAQMGELMTTVGSAMSDEEWEDFKTQMRSHMKEAGRNKRERYDRSNSRPFDKNTKRHNGRTHFRYSAIFRDQVVYS